MDTPAIQSIIARCLLDGEFLRCMLYDPGDALKAYSLDDVTQNEFMQLDVEQVRRFAGFITKVQHNHLWDAFPYTRTLMRHYRIEHSVFTAYLDVYLRLRREARWSREEKIQHFAGFLQSYLESASDGAFPALMDVLTHEHTLWELKRQLEDLGPRNTDAEGIRLSCIPVSQLRRWIPVPHRTLRLGIFRYNPLEIADRLRHQASDVASVPIRRSILVYYQEPATSQLRILELDEISAALLLEIDGTRSMRAVIHRVVQHFDEKVPVSQFRPFFDIAVAEGMLTMVPQPRQKGKGLDDANSICRQPSF
jgi:hypothetical protein